MFSFSQIDGGFRASQSTQSSEPGPSPVRGRGSQGTFPLTAKQISLASRSSDDTSIYQIDGVDFTNVKLVGMVFDKTERVTDVNFTLDDGTGRIGCKLWINETFDKKANGGYRVSSRPVGFYDGMYIRLIGHLKNFQDKPQVVAFSLRPITNFDEVTHHFIECVHKHLQILQSKGDSLAQSQVMNTSQSTPVKSESSGFHSTPPAQVSVDGLKECDQMVLNYLQQASSLAQEKGVHRDEIARKLKLPIDKIMESITFLEGEGLIYSTIDEFHFKSTAA